MGLDTGKVFKRFVFCPHCKEDYLFTLRAIANNLELKCHGCGGSIRLSDRAYESLLRDVRNTLSGIDTAKWRPLLSPGSQDWRRIAPFMADIPQRNGAVRSRRHRLVPRPRSTNCLNFP